MTFSTCHVKGWYSRWWGRDGMSTPQNGAAVYWQSHVPRIFQGSFPLPSVRFSSSCVSFSRGRFSLTACRGFPLASLSLASRQLPMHTPRFRLATRDQVILVLRRNTLVGLYVCDLTQPLLVLWPAGICTFVCIIHLEAAVTHAPRTTWTHRH